MSVTLKWFRFDAVPFGLGGVITPAASIHQRRCSAPAAADLVVGDLGGESIGEPTSEVRT